MKKYINKILITTLATCCLGCGKDFLSTRPSDKLSDGVVFTTLEGAQLVLTGAYDWFTNGWLAHYTNQYIFFMPDLMGEDAFVSTTNNYGRFVNAYLYSISPNSTYTTDPWKGTYSLIDNVNAVLDNIENLPAGSERNRIQGEALALRAYAYHFLIRFYAKPVNRYPETPGVILRTTSSIEDLPRSTVKQVYDQMVQDLTTAIPLLTNASGAKRAYIDKRTAEAILARVYLDLGDETNGIKQAEEAVKGIDLMDEDEYQTSFCEVNSETLWAFECPTDDKQSFLSLPAFWYYADGCTESTDEKGNPKYTYTNVVDGYSSLRVSENLVNLMDDADVRKTQFPVTNKGNLVRYPMKNGGVITTKIRSRNNQMGEGAFNMIRASEMYLIIAELAADNSHFDKARTALNTVRTARGLSAYAGNDADLVNEIQLERRRELFAEGHRLFDIKRRNLPLNRTGIEGHDLWSGSPINLPAGSDKFELPIPQSEIDANKALTNSDQNPAYK